MNTIARRRGLAVGIVGISIAGLAASGAWASDAVAETTIDTVPADVTLPVDPPTDDEIADHIAAMREYAECLRDEGVDVPELDLDDEDFPRFAMREAMDELRDEIRDDPEAFADARDACAELRPERPEGAGRPDGAGLGGRWADEDGERRGMGRFGGHGPGDGTGACMDDDEQAS